MTTTITARDPAIRRVIDAFYEAFVRHFNPPALAEPWLAMPPRTRSRQPKTHLVLPRIDGGKDASLAKKMLAAWGEETTLRLIEEYFRRWQQGDQRVMRSDGTMGGFWMVAPYLLTHPHGHSRTNANAMAAARATQPMRAEKEKEPWIL